MHDDDVGRMFENDAAARAVARRLGMDDASKREVNMMDVVNYGLKQ